MIHSFGTSNVRCKYLVSVDNRVYEVNAAVAQLINVLKTSQTKDDVVSQLTNLNNITYTVNDIDKILEYCIHPMLKGNNLNID